MRKVRRRPAGCARTREAFAPWRTRAPSGPTSICARTIRCARSVASAALSSSGAVRTPVSAAPPTCTVTYGSTTAVGSLAKFITVKIYTKLRSFYLQMALRFERHLEQFVESRNRELCGSGFSNRKSSCLLDLFESFEVNWGFFCSVANPIERRVDENDQGGSTVVCETDETSCSSRIADVASTSTKDSGFENHTSQGQTGISNDHPNASTTASTELPNISGYFS